MTENSISRLACPSIAATREGASPATCASGTLNDLAVLTLALIRLLVHGRELRSEATSGAEAIDLGTTAEADAAETRTIAWIDERGAEITFSARGGAYSMTSFARSCSEGGIPSPSVAAVLRFTVR